jgi:hypothetical protein
MPSTEKKKKAVKKAVKDLPKGLNKNTRKLLIQLEESERPKRKKR